MKKDDIANKSTKSIIREQPPLATPESVEVPFPKVVEAQGGMPVYLLDVTDQQVVRVSFVFKAGTSAQQAPFIASTTANMLSEGSGQSSALQIAERLDYYGSYYDVSIDRDYSVITFVSLSKFFEKTLEVAAEILLQPSFAEHELTTYCQKRKQRLAVERSKIGHRVRELFARSLFGADHPYGVSHPEQMYDSVTRDLVSQFYSTHYTAANCFVVCSGNIKQQQQDSVLELASQMSEGIDIDAVNFPSPSPVPFAFEAYPGAVQSALRVGRIMFPRMHPDYIGMQVLTTVLGGYFGSRLVHNLREERGYTYGVFCGMVNLENAGYMAISTEVGSEVTVDSLTQIFAEMQRLRDEPVGEHELSMVRNIMTGEVMRILDGPFGIADVTIENIQNDTDNGYLDRFLEQVKSITPQRLQQLAREYLDPAAFTTVVVGDGSLEEQLVRFR